MHTHVYIRDAVVQLEHGSFSSHVIIDIGYEILYRYSVNTVESHLDRKMVCAHAIGPFNQTRREFISLSGEINSRHALRRVCVDHDYHSAIVLGQDSNVVDG
jgi:hypothetical protein